MLVKSKPTLKITRNRTILMLLSEVPEFKRDIDKIRTKYKINETGFKWFSKEMTEWSIKNKLKDYTEFDEEDGLDINTELVIENFPRNSFERDVKKIGIKYKLPFNFYASPYTGITRYILSGEIRAPLNNFEMSFCVDENSFSWATLVIYKPLTDAESKNLQTELEEKFKMIKSYTNHDEIFQKNGNSKNIDRDISLLIKQKSRKEKPKKVKSIKEGTYLDRLTKSRDVTPSQIKKAKKENKKNIVVKFNEVTSKQIGKEHKISGDATRQSKTRLNSLAKDLFGYDLEL